MPTLEILPLQPHEFESQPAGFEYPDENISQHYSASAFETAVDLRDGNRCVVCGQRSVWGDYPPIQKALIVQEMSGYWCFLKDKGFVPLAAKNEEYEPRNSIKLCKSHHNDFKAYRFFIRWVPSLSAFVFVNFSRVKELEQYHGKRVVLDPSHPRSPFPAPFLIHEMRSRGCFPQFADRAISFPLSPTHTMDIEDQHVPDARQDLSESGTGSRRDVPTESGRTANDLKLDDPSKEPGLIDFLQQQWKQLPNWTAANIEGQSWDGTTEENVKKYIDLLRVSEHHHSK